MKLVSMIASLCTAHTYACAIAYAAERNRASA